ncbi:MAG: outer membrane beta-barrel protein, partial [Bacteroidota bacterium]|nr:outer membrane beta-barrel protein [Bacteroidota bacterium]
MFRSILVLALLLITAQDLLAQFSISGTVKDGNAKTALSGASIRLFSTTDTTFEKSTLSDSAGKFLFQNLHADSFLLSISFIGYKEMSKSIRLDSTIFLDAATATRNVNMDVSMVSGSSKDLTAIVISTRLSPVVQKADTLQMDASQYKVNPDATTEDLVKKMPGITIENGQVKAQGEVVQKVTIDGRELFGDDATAALRNLPAEVVDKIQVFDRLSDQARFSGFDDGSAQKGINIITKANMRNGQFGRVFAGYGTDSRYLAGGNTTILKENKRISVVGNFNNVNQQNFSQQDLLGVTSNTQRGGGGGGPRGARGGGNGGNRGQGGGFQGGGNNGAFGNSGNFLVGQQAGINKTNAFGLNYSDIWGKKLTVTGSYFFNNTGNTTAETSNQQYFLASIPSIAQITNSSSNNNNNRLNLRLEYRIDSANQLIVSPNLSFQNNSSNRVTTTNSFMKIGQNISSTTNKTSSDRVGNNLNNTILYRHSFPKRGRTFTINLNTSSNKRDGNVFVDGNQRSYDSVGVVYKDSLTRRYTDQSSNGYQLSANINYTEPLGAKSQLQVSYNPSYSNSKSDQESFRYNNSEGKFSVFDTSLSNRFTNISKAQNAGLAYRYGDRENQFSFGANYQYSTLNSNQDFPKALTVSKSFNNILPSANLQLKLSTRSSVRLNYRMNTNNPSVTQLSDVFDITNLPYITAGNPNLKQQVTNVVGGRYTYTNTSKGLVFVGNIFYQAAADYITNATYVPTRDSVINSKLTV